MSMTYVFFNRRICGVDGSIQYIYNKEKYLTAKGYKVLVFSVVDGKIYVNQMKKYRKYIVPEMRFVPSLFRGTERKRILKHIVSLINQDKSGKVIIESTSPVSAAWGELAAKELRCKHVYYHLMEKTQLAEDFRQFCRFKYNRNELAGITDNTVPMMLNDPNAKPNKISAFCTNVYADAEDVFSPKLDKRAKYTIGSIGRLEKPYVPVLATELGKYFVKHGNIRFNLVMIGGEADGKEAAALRDQFRKIRNVKLIITDYLYPIPYSLINNIDVFVSTAGAANGTYKEQRPTIKIHPITGNAIGIIGCDFGYGERGLYEEDKSLSIENCIDRVLNGSADITYVDYDSIEYDGTIRTEFDRQLKSVLSNKSENRYFSEKKINKLKTPFKRFHGIYSVVCHVIGGKGLIGLIALLDKIKSRFFLKGNVE